MTSNRERGSVKVEAGMVESIASRVTEGTSKFLADTATPSGEVPPGGQGASHRNCEAPSNSPGFAPANPSLPASSRGAAWPKVRACACLLLLAVGALLAGGCGQFFAKTTTTGTGTGTGGSGTGTTTYLYAANQNGTGLSNIAGFALNSGTLTAVSGSPYNLGDTPLALALAPNNKFLYVAGQVQGIYVFPVNNDGSLGAGSALGLAFPQAIAIDPTGQWLLAMSPQPGGVPQLSVFAINTITGALTIQQTQTVNLDAGKPGRLLFVPGSTSTSLVYATLLTGGLDVLTFDSSAGVLTKVSLNYGTGGNAFSDTGLGVTPNGQYLYVADIGSGGVNSYAIQTDGSLTSLGATTLAGPAVNGVTVDATGTYLYVSNTNTTIGNATPANVINAFSISSTDGTLTPVTGSPFAACSTPIDLAEDSTKSYLAVACQGGSPDLQVFPFSSSVPGGLGTPFGASTGTTTPAGASVVVASH